MGILLFVIFEKADGMGPGAAGADAGGSRGEERIGAGAGELFVTDQLLTLELAGVLLTVSMVGAVIIAKTLCG